MHGTRTSNISKWLHNTLKEIKNLYTNMSDFLLDMVKQKRSLRQKFNDNTTSDMDMG